MNAVRHRAAASAASLLLAAPPVLARQQPPAGGSASAQEAWAQTDKKAAEGDGARARDAERPIEEELTRRKGESNRKLCQLPDRDTATLEQRRQLLEPLYRLPDALALSPEPSALRDGVATRRVGFEWSAN